MLQNSRVTACTLFELLRENQLGGGGKIPPLTQSGLNTVDTNLETQDKLRKMRSGRIQIYPIKFKIYVTLIPCASIFLIAHRVIEVQKF